MEQELIIALSTIGGVLVGGVPVILTTFIKEHYRSKRASKELVINLGKEYWLQAVELAKRSGGTVASLESFIVSTSYLLNTLKDNLGEEEIKSTLTKHRRLLENVREIYK